MDDEVNQDGSAQWDLQRDPGDSRYVSLPADFFNMAKDDRVQHIRAFMNTGMGNTHTETIRNWYTGGDPAAVRALTAVVVQDPDAEVQRWALAALSRIPDPAVIPAMLRALESPDRVNRMHAVLTIGRIRAREAVPKLIPLLEDRRSRVVVAQSLVAIRDERALEPLKAAASKGWWWQRSRLRKCVAELETSLGY